MKRLSTLSVHQTQEPLAPPLLSSPLLSPNRLHDALSVPLLHDFTMIDCVVALHSLGERENGERGKKTGEMRKWNTEEHGEESLWWIK